jgi:hypothetical protein
MMEAIQTVDIGNVKSMIPKHRRQRQKSQGLGPEIISGKIVNPRIDQQDMGSVGFQIKYSS